MEKEEEKDADASSPNVQTISKMENVIVAAVTREDVVREPLNVNASLASLSKLQQSKPSLKIRTANAICWIYLGIFRDYGLKNIFFRNKTFLFFKIES